MNDLDRQERRYDRMQLWMLLGIVVGTAGMSIGEVYDLLGAEDGGPIWTSLVSLVGWGVVCTVLFSTARRESSDFLAAVVDDERVTDIRRQAYQAALSAVLVLQIVLLVGGAVLYKATGVELSVSFTANLTIGLALAVALGRFLQLNR